MLFLLSRRVPSSYPVLALIATNLVISMPAPPSKRSPVDSNDPRNGFSSVPKILEIQLPLKIASKDDLVAWAKYVMGLMASKINITLTTVKESSPKTFGGVRTSDAIRNFDNVKQSQNSRNSEVKGFNRVQVNGLRQFSNANSFENARYAENIRNLGHVTNFDRAKVPATVRILENAKQLENVRSSLKNGNIQLSTDTQFSTPNVPTIAISGVTTNNLFNNRQLQPSFGNLGIIDTTLPNPLEITANINVPRSGIKEAAFKETFDTTSSLKINDQQMFVPQFPDFGPVIDVKNNDIFRNTNAASPPTRTYLPVTTTTDNVRFPSDPFVTRYFFDGVERNVSRNLGVLATDVTFTTHNPLIFSDEIPLPVKSTDLLSQQRNSSSIKPLFKVPFEAVITFTREGSIEATTLRNDRNQYITTPNRNSLQQFPPYFDSNYTLTNESGQINVVFDDNGINEKRNSTKKEDRKKDEKKKESSKRQKSKKQKTSTRLQSPITQFLKNFVALRRNNTPAVDLSPPPLNQELTTQKVPTRHRIPSPQRAPPPQRTQQYYPPRNPPSALRQGRRNQTSLAQALEDDDNGSKEDDTDEEDSKSKEDGKENSDSNENGGNSSKNDDVESNEETDDDSSNESSSSESESEEEGGSIQGIIELLQLAGPILEDLSDPESDTELSEVLDTAIPLLQDLSDPEAEGGSDIPGLLLPILLRISGGMDGMADSAAILTPIIQLIAPLSGPLSGPLLVPLSRQSSKPPGQGGSSSGDIFKASSGPLLQPAGPGRMTVLSNLVAGVISSLSKNSGGGGKSDITSLVKAIVAGSVAGSSAGSSGPRDSYGAPTSYGGEYAYGPPPSPYGQPNTPSQHPNPLALLGSSIKDIFNAILRVVASLLSTISSVLGASSNSGNAPSPTYGPPRPTNGPPRTYGPPRQISMVRPSDSISITTSRPERFAGF